MKIRNTGFVCKLMYSMHSGYQTSIF